MPHDDRRFRESLDRAYATACDALLAERNADGFWLGELSSSALATATAVSALSLVRDADSILKSEISDLKSQISNLKSEISNLKSQIVSLVSAGVRWLAEHQNADGGWGDTPDSLSNISTTMLVRAAFHLAGAAEPHATALDGATAYIDKAGGAAAVVARYGKDRTFAVPILANCALAGQADWHDVASLPFELAALPHGFFRFLRLHVVSYALPALIAIGQLIHVKRPSWNLIARLLRRLAVGPTLRKLEAIQPSSGGFLEAIPLTSFVIMSLAAAGRANHPVVTKGVEFLRGTVRADGSWPIDSNLSIWLTTLSINALAVAGKIGDGTGGLSTADACRVRDWLLAEQLRQVHPYTHAAFGGWGWSHLSGSVPDADDTPGALLALATFAQGAEDKGQELRIRGRPQDYRPGPPKMEIRQAADRGLEWLFGLQNDDGGWPTFCRGWGRLPFDRSGADLTAHAVRACIAWRPDIAEKWKKIFELRASGRRVRVTGPTPTQLNTAIAHGFEYLGGAQHPDGSWLPLWFGNQNVPDDGNPTYGTARVLAAYRDAEQINSEVALRGVTWLLGAQNSDGGWGGGSRSPSSVEETAIAFEALAGIASDPVQDAVRRGIQWLIDRVESGEWRKPSPIGLYFAKLWYSEKLYPLIFTVAGLGRARRVLTH